MEDLKISSLSTVFTVIPSPYSLDNAFLPDLRLKRPRTLVEAGFAHACRRRGYAENSKKIRGFEYLRVTTKTAYGKY
ncbi:hypothetical protein GCM10023183_03800 [Nibribacter koreensis]|uniref:Uncharacterized protein n=1 Tax=Nibribacter koreensis TaxID=1084519 RepID=A0ABP8F7A9_9BACT